MSWPNAPTCPARHRRHRSIAASANPHRPGGGPPQHRPGGGPLQREPGGWVTWSTTLTVALAAWLLTALGGCAQPGPAVPGLPLRSAQALGLSALQPTPPLAERWWQAWGDARLNQLVDQALQDQPSLQAAAARLAAAEALARGAGAAAGAQAGLSADATVQRFSSVGLVPSAVAGQVRSSANVQAGLSLPLDFFGRHAAALQAALGQQQAAALALQAARSALITQVVRQYTALARLQAQQVLAQDQLALHGQALALVQQRVQAGLDNQLDLRQAEQPLPELRAQLEALAEQQGLLRHQLALLCGQPPQALVALQARLQAAALPAPLQVGADLLGRRPDVLAARWRVEAAGQDVSAARAAFYPDVNLSAFVGLNALGLNHLLDLGARTAGVGPALRLPLFDGGRLQANLAGRQAERDAAVAAYNSAVLDALREAADALASQQSLARQQAHQQAALVASSASLALARERQGAGLGNRLPVLAAEQALLAQRRLLIDLQARQADVQAQLMHALGGGWAEARGPAPQDSPSGRPLAAAPTPPIPAAWLLPGD